MRRFLFLGVVLAGLSLVGIGVTLWWLLQPMQATATQDLRFVVPKGQAVTVIGERLTQAGLLKHPLVFRAVVWHGNLEKKLQAGSFTLKKSLTPLEIATTLTQGTNDVWVTIPEGLRREEIAQLFTALELPAFAVVDFLVQTEGLEGQLYPDTYLIPKEITAEAVVNLLTRTYQAKQITPNAALLAESSRTEREVLILASLVEREALGKVQMQLVASILAKRLEIGMPLQVDATLQYAKGFNGNEWWSPPLAADKNLASSFNTYQNPGLPPTPICSPGAEAFLAALQPTETEYLFYLHDTQGKIHPAKTLDEHNAHIAEYLR